MGLFSRSPGLSRDDLKQLLYDIRILEPDDREALQEAFSNYASGGINKFEVKRVIDHLVYEKHESVNRSEAKAVRRRLIRALKGK